MQKKNRRALAAILALLIALLAGCGPTGTATPDNGVTPFITIEGPGVESPVTLTLDEMKAMSDDLVEEDYFSINTYGTEEYFHFKGIWVWAVIEQKVLLKEEAKTASFVAEDGYTVTYTLEEVQREDYIDQQNPATNYKMILAWEENGEEYDPAEGNPFRLVNGQKESGDINKPLWVSQVNKIVVE